MCVRSGRGSSLRVDPPPRVEVALLPRKPAQSCPSGGGKTLRLHPKPVEQNTQATVRTRKNTSTATRAQLRGPDTTPQAFLPCSWTISSIILYCNKCVRWRPHPNLSRAGTSHVSQGCTSDPKLKGEGSKSLQTGHYQRWWHGSTTFGASSSPKRVIINGGAAVRRRQAGNHH